MDKHLRFNGRTLWINRTLTSDKSDIHFGYTGHPAQKTRHCFVVAFFFFSCFFFVLAYFFFLFFLSSFSSFSLYPSCYYFFLFSFFFFIFLCAIFSSLSSLSSSSSLFCLFLIILIISNYSTFLPPMCFVFLFVLFFRHPPLYLILPFPLLFLLFLPPFLFYRASSTTLHASTSQLPILP